MNKVLHSTYVPGDVQSALYNETLLIPIRPHVIGRRHDCHVHFAHGETEAQRGLRLAQHHIASQCRIQTCLIPETTLS